MNEGSMDSSIGPFFVFSGKNGVTLSRLLPRLLAQESSDKLAVPAELDS